MEAACHLWPCKELRWEVPSTPCLINLKLNVEGASWRCLEIGVDSHTHTPTHTFTHTHIFSWFSSRKCSSLRNSSISLERLCDLGRSQLYFQHNQYNTMQARTRCYFGTKSAARYSKRLIWYGQQVCLVRNLATIFPDLTYIIYHYLTLLLNRFRNVFKLQALSGTWRASCAAAQQQQQHQRLKSCTAWNAGFADHNLAQHSWCTVVVNVLLVLEFTNNQNQSISFNKICVWVCIWASS